MFLCILYDCFTYCTSANNLISSPTNTPPVSKAVFHPNPKSLRLIAPFNDKPILVFPHGSCNKPLYSPFNSTGLVTSLIVKSPVTV